MAALLQRAEQRMQHRSHQRQRQSHVTSLWRACDRDQPCAHAGALGKNRDLHRIGQKAGGAFGGIDGPDDEHTAFAFVSDGGHRLGFGQAGGGQQGGHFGHGVFGFAGPATGFPDIDEADGRDGAFGLLGQFTEKALFLGAGHHHGLAGFDGFLKLPSLATAQGGVQCQVFTQCFAQSLGLQGHGLVAVANQGGHVLGVR